MASSGCSMAASQAPPQIRLGSSFQGSRVGRVVPSVVLQGPASRSSRHALAVRAAVTTAPPGMPLLLPLAPLQLLLDSSSVVVGSSDDELLGKFATLVCRRELVKLALALPAQLSELPSSPAVDVSENVGPWMPPRLLCFHRPGHRVLPGRLLQEAPSSNASGGTGDGCRDPRRA